MGGRPAAASPSPQPDLAGGEAVGCEAGGQAAAAMLWMLLICSRVLDIFFMICSKL